ncbi:11467_t:CDS:2, partial [Entrophospora sp. SA101]
MAIANLKALAYNILKEFKTPIVSDFVSKKKILLAYLNVCPYPNCDEKLDLIEFPMHDSESSGISSIAGNLEKNLGISSLDTVDEIMEDDSDLQSTDPNSNTDPYDNAFDIEIDKTKTVSELKQVIKNSQKPFFNNVAVKNLKLWKVDISFDEPNEKLSVLRDKTCSVIKEQLRGMEMRPILKIDEYFSDIPEGKHIHIIVEHPSVIKKETNDKINIKVDELSKMILDLIKEQHKSKVAISSVNCSDWERIQESTGLDIKTVNLDVEYDTENIVAYQWNGRQEREQKDRYLSHLRNILKISRYHLLELYDTTNDKNFLGIVDNILPIRLFDKTDAIIVDSEIYQAMAELTTADLKSKY